MKGLDDYAPDDLKRIYRILHSQLQGDPELMDSELLHDLQTWLQGQATAQGVDISDHAQWSAWLHNGAAAPCPDV